MAVVLGQAALVGRWGLPTVGTAGASPLTRGRLLRPHETGNRECDPLRVAQRLPVEDAAPRVPSLGDGLLLFLTLLASIDAVLKCFLQKSAGI